MNTITSFITQVLSEYFLLSVFVICLSVGYILKHSLAFIPNKTIPAILGLLGVALSVWAAKSLSLETLAIGFISGLTATGGYEFWKYLKDSLFGLTDNAE